MYIRHLSTDSVDRMYRADSRSIFRSTLGRELVDTPSTCRSTPFLFDRSEVATIGRHSISISWSMTRRQVDHYVSVNRRCHIGDISVDYRSSHISADRVDMSVDKKSTLVDSLKSKADSRYSKVKKNGF